MEHPDAEALMHYYALIEELAAREAAAAGRTGQMTVAGHAGPGAG
ncbi:hypothetical protein [Arthrobacter crystallopoietes]|nr:hypothetical protein [Arthrobacter crystallopoietes]